MKLPRDIVSSPAIPRDTLLSIVRIVLLYALFASLWILLSDRAVGLLFSDPEGLQAANTLKGLVFVATTSVLLFFLVLRFAARRNGEAQDAKVGAGETAPRLARRGLIAGIVLLSVVFTLLGVGAILQNTHRHRLDAGKHLASIAELKARQMEAWIEERRRDAQVVRTASLFREALPQWRKRGDAAARARLLARLDGFRTTMRYDGITLCDAEGEILLQSNGGGPGMRNPLRQQVRQAVADGAIRMVGPFRMDAPAPAHAHLDFVVPLLPAPGKDAAEAAVVLHVDVAATLYPFLQSWPIPSETAETLLFRRDGDTVLYLNELRHEQGTALTKRIALTQNEVLAVQALAPNHRPGALLEGVDYRGVPVVGVAQAVAGTDWWLIAKIDRRDIFREMRRDALWIAFSSFVTWLVALTLAGLFFQRHELRHAQRQHHEQAERLRALQLLDAIAGSSPDAIFAKDASGHYLLFNKTAARVTGKPAEEVLGHDDHILFPPEQAERIMANDREVMAKGRIETYQEKLATANGEIVFLATKGPLYDAAGKVFGLFGISRDITQIKQVEAALQRQADELLDRNAELERFNRAMVGRELDMIALKRLANSLAHELGREPPFALDFVTNPPDVASR